MKICINAGHTLNSSGSGSVGIKTESIETRKVAEEVIRLLKQEGHVVIDSTVDSANSQSEYLKKCVDTANNNCDLFVSIHFNSFNGRAFGTEVLIYSSSSKSKDKAERVCKNISDLGFKNRGVKERSDLYVLKHTKMPSLLVECCFIDNIGDMNIYNPMNMARAIAEGLLNKNIVDSQEEEKNDETCL
ncbi:MAG TPA: N-acetylmuramoyl-L-alanine amidase [Peptostreptococcaceae bacterium]|nr:N-acetylmuramoyl-L-alanine amidase [Peptostreptococcaceae bacterium]